MSALALIFDRSGAPVPSARLAALLDALSHRAVDGRDAHLGNDFALGHCHFWTTPEEIEEHQPLQARPGGPWLSFCGRIDNRAELAGSLGLAGEDSTLPSDARLVLLALERWGAGALERFLGPFALVLVESSPRRILCARDVLGDRALFYHLRSDLFAAASEEAALLTLPGVSSEPDATSLARFFAPEEPSAGATFFSHIRELEPGHFLEITAGESRLRSFAEPPRAKTPRYARDEDYVEHFAEVLALAVRARLRSTGPAAVMMSGGLDSTSLAATARKIQPDRDVPIHAVSYVFDELASCDERPYIDAVTRHSGLAPLQISGDHLWPLKDLSTWPRNPSTPLEGPYRRLRQALYEHAARHGIRTLLTGEFGDELYAGGEDWLLDLLRERRLLRAADGIARDRWLRFRGRRPGPHGLRRAVGRVLGRPSHRDSSVPGAWLTPAALRELSTTPWQPAAPTGRLSQAWALLHPSTAWGNVTEPFHASRAGIEVRRPYRDRRLIELALGLPAHLLYRPGESKWILRRSMRGHLPELVRSRQQPTSLLELLRRGLDERERDSAYRLLFSPEAFWRPFVRESWMRQALSYGLNGPDGPGLLVIWRSFCIELWRQSGFRHGPASGLQAQPT